MKRKPPQGGRRGSMKRTSLAIVAVLLGSCAQPSVVTNQADPSVLSDLDAASRQARSHQPEAVRDALLPPLRAEFPKSPGAPVEPRFDLVVNAASAQQVFMSIVSGTRYSMVVNPGVGGTVSVNLKDVTVREALEAIREAYGYEFRIDGTRIYVESAGLQTRVYQMNYLMGLRSGRSDMRVSSGAISGVQQGGGGAVPPVAPAAAGSPASVQALALRTLIGPGEGRSIVVSPQSGVIVVRAMPNELRIVEKYLKAMRLSVER